MRNGVVKAIQRVSIFVFCEDELLFIKANSGKFAGYYFPLGGHIEEGENVVEASKREAYEESGLELPDLKLKGVFQQSGFFGDNVTWFFSDARVDSKEVVESEEGKLYWVKVDSISRLKTISTVKKVVDLIRESRHGELIVGTCKFNGKDRLLSFDARIQ